MPTMKTLSPFLALGLLSSGGLASSQKPLSGNLDLDATPQTAAPPYRKHLLDTHKQLVDISSISGHEVAVANFLHTYLPTLGFETWLQALPASNTSSGYLSERYNVVARPRSKSTSQDSSAKVLVTSHIDVVPPYIPYHISDGQITSDSVISGRGSVDAKASVAAQIIAVEELLSSNSNINPADILLLFVVGEETLGDGMRFFSDNLAKSSASNSTSIKAAIFGEPTENKLACGHKGITFGTIRAKGKAGHSGYPWLGKSATEVLIHALGKILAHDFGKSERYGNTTVNVGRIEGGVAANVIPKYAEAEVSLRIAVGDRNTGADLIRKQLRDILQEVDKEALSLESKGGYGPIECECEVEGFEKMVANYGTDVPHLRTQGGHVSYLYGPGSILVAHGDDEALTVGELEDAVEGYKKLIEHALEA